MKNLADARKTLTKIGFCRLEHHFLKRRANLGWSGFKMSVEMNLFKIKQVISDT